jgi:hypothetical protein
VRKLREDAKQSTLAAWIRHRDYETDHLACALGRVYVWRAKQIPVSRRNHFLENLT